MLPVRQTRRYHLVLLIGKAVAGLVVLVVILTWLAYLDVSLRYRHAIVTPDKAPARPVAIVFGAGVYPGGRLSPVLADRMRTAIALYEAGKVRKLLLSGDNRFIEYNEPAAMAAFARAQGLPETALAYDYAGRRTYDTCWRARYIFGQESVLLVSQGFHLPRAVYLCRQLGVNAVGVVADGRFYSRLPFWMLREALARVQAWLDVHLLHPRPVGGEPIDIFAPDYRGNNDASVAQHIRP